MISKARLTQLRALRQKKFRKEQGLFVAEGEKLVGELLHSPLKVESIYAKEDWLKKNAKAANAVRETIEVDDDELSRISSLVTPQEVLAVVHIPARNLDLQDVLNDYTLVLDGIRDPGNLGTIIRIADWFGIRNVVVSPDSAEMWNPKVVQASMGSLIRVQVHELELQSFFAEVNAFAKSKSREAPVVYGTFLGGTSIYETPFSSSGMIVIGNESNGIRPETEPFISERITIPAWNAHSKAESLNAGVATAIVCSEARRQTR